jgi:hypothetical protein
MDPARSADLAVQLFGAKPERTLALLRAAWPVAVGPELARRTEVISADRGVLRVRVPDANWRRSLWRMRGEILGRLRQVAGRLGPRSIGFVEGPLSSAPPEATAPGQVEQSAVAEPPTSVIDAAATISDDELRAEFLAVAGRYLGRFTPAEAARPKRTR